jgi:endonuclease-8
VPEGHSVHRIARQFRANFLGTRPEITSPQGRFVAGAKLISGQEVTDARAVGKQLFIGFANELWLRVHLGIYGAWDFSGSVRVDPSIVIHPQTGASTKLGQTGMAGPVDEAGEDSVSSIGAPRKTRVRMAEQDRDEVLESFPPEPVGQVRVRLLNETVCADLRGPTACEVQTAEEMRISISRLGPDPANDDSEAEAQRFLSRAQKKGTAIGQVLMDQSVIAGIGNVYRAEMLFRAHLDPHTPAKTVDPSVLRELWDDWKYLLSTGITVGQMMTIDGLQGQEYQDALRNRDDRHWVYKREGQACKRCGADIVLEEMAARKLYWCPGCQYPRTRSEAVKR